MLASPRPRPKRICANRTHLWSCGISVLSPGCASTIWLIGPCSSSKSKILTLLPLVRRETSPMFVNSSGMNGPMLWMELLNSQTKPNSFAESLVLLKMMVMKCHNGALKRMERYSPGDILFLLKMPNWTTTKKPWSEKSSPNVLGKGIAIPSIGFLPYQDGGSRLSPLWRWRWEKYTPTDSWDWSSRFYGPPCLATTSYRQAPE